jgi:hypothetical protein
MMKMLKILRGCKSTKNADEVLKLMKFRGKKSRRQGSSDGFFTLLVILAAVKMCFG